MDTDGSPPRVALALGYAGLIPFVGLAAASLAAPAEPAAFAAKALLAYGATILSFLGGVHWGLAIAARERAPGAFAMSLAIGVLPQLLGWAALLVSLPIGALMTASGLVALLAADAQAVRRGLAPGWFFTLRWPLSAAAATATAVSAAAALS